MGDIICNENFNAYDILNVIEWSSMPDSVAYTFLEDLWPEELEELCMVNAHVAELVKRHYK